MAIMAMDITEILEEREPTHGDFREVARIDQRFRALLADSPNWPYLSDCQKLSLEMITHKLSRILCGDPNHRDHTDDISGYAALFHLDRKSNYPHAPKDKA